jgi:hypothetical protein
MKYRDLAQAYFPNSKPDVASTLLGQKIRANVELKEKYLSSLGGKTKTNNLSYSQIKLIKSYLGPLPRGRKKLGTPKPVPTAKTKKVQPVITGVTLHRGDSLPGLKIEWEEKEGKIFIGGLEIETVDVQKEVKKAGSPEHERVIETMFLMQKDRGNCMTLDPKAFPSLTKYKLPTQFASYCISKYFKKYPEMKGKEAFKVKIGLAPGTARIIKIA